MLNVYIYGYSGEESPPIVMKCVELIREKGYRITDNLRESDLAIAPLLRELVSPEAISAPRIGTLVFHPSLLPRHRGYDAIKWAFKLKEAYTGVTWFWPDSGIDTGDICEQEVVAIYKGDTPKTFYERAVIPAAIRTLGRALFYIDKGNIRRVPQVFDNGTYEPKFQNS